MGFRRDGKDPELRWRKRSRERLIQAGLPPIVVDDERRWAYVLLHGNDALDTGWSSADLTLEQCRRLLGVLEEQYPNPIGLWLIEDMQRRIQSG